MYVNTPSRCNIVHLTLDFRPPVTAELTVGFAGGREAIVELSNARRSLEDRQAGRPLVYLDQNHWSTIAGAREGRPGVTTEQARAAEVLVGLVEDRRILLPVSGDHLPAPPTRLHPRLDRLKPPDRISPDAVHVHGGAGVGEAG